MSSEIGKELNRERKRSHHAAGRLRKHEISNTFHEKKGRTPQERLFPDLHAHLFVHQEKLEGHAGLFDTAGRTGNVNLFDREDIAYGKHADLPDCYLRGQLADTAEEMREYLQPEKRTGAELKTIRDKLSALEQTLTEFSEASGGLTDEQQKLLKSVRQKKRQLDRLAAKNVPVNPEALRSFNEVQMGIEAGDAANLLVSDMLESLSGILNGQKSSVDGMRTEELEHLVNEADAMRSRHRYTKEQQSLGYMEQEYLGRSFARSNRVLQEANETKSEPQIRRETGAHGERAEIFEKRKGEEERDALGKKHDILMNNTKANRNNLIQKQDKDGLEAVRSMMHNGERKMGFAPLAAMGVGGNLYKGFSGMNYMMSMSPVAVDMYKKRAEIQGITERYLGLDQMYRNFMTKNSDLRDRTAFLKRYGMEGNVRMMIRKEQEKALGIGSQNRMNSFIMQHYARELWKGAFLKEDGSVITERERRAEDPEKRQRRKLFADVLRAMGFNVRYLSAEGELPGVGAAEIFKRLLL